MPGPQRTATALKVIAGTDRPGRRADEAEAPKFPVLAEFPKPPSHLKADGKHLWEALGKELVACGVLQTVDVYALEQLCYLWQRFRKRAKVDEEVTAADNSMLKSMWGEFGLTPAARRRVVASITQPEPANRFAGHGKQPTPGPR